MTTGRILMGMILMTTGIFMTVCKIFNRQCAKANDNIFIKAVSVKMKTNNAYYTSHNKESIILVKR